MMTLKAVGIFSIYQQLDKMESLLSVYSCGASNTELFPKIVSITPNNDSMIFNLKNRLAEDL